MERAQRLIDRWKNETIAFVWKGTRQEFEKEKQLELIGQGNGQHQYKDAKGQIYIFNDNKKTWYRKGMASTHKRAFLLPMSKLYGQVDMEEI